MRSHHKQLLVPLLMRWSKTLAHICNPRNLDLAAPTLPWCTGLLQPSTSTVLVKHLNSSNPHPPPLPPSSCFYYFKLECTVCIVLSVFGCVRFWRRAAVARIYEFLFSSQSYESCVFGLHPKRFKNQSLDKFHASRTSLLQVWWYSLSDNLAFAQSQLSKISLISFLGILIHSRRI